MKTTENPLKNEIRDKKLMRILGALEKEKNDIIYDKKEKIKKIINDGTLPLKVILLGKLFIFIYFFLLAIWSTIL